MTRLEIGDLLEGTARDAVRARVADWPYDPTVAQIVLLDHHMLPTPDAVTRWVTGAIASRPQTRAIRTGAMFPEAAEAFQSAGFHVIDTLALLEAPLGDIGQSGERRRRSTTQRLRSHHMSDAALVDRRAFGDPWGNDATSLASISEATPRHRARFVPAVLDDNSPDRPDSSAGRAGAASVDGQSDTSGRQRIGGFAITGQSGVFGYLQRLAVDPGARRRGIADTLVKDSMHWMRRRGATTAMVNTALDNDAALALYHGHGFRRRPDTLTILELSDLTPFAARSTPR